MREDVQDDEETANVYGRVQAGCSEVGDRAALRAFDRSSLGTCDLDGDFCSRKHRFEGVVREHLLTSTELAEVTQCASAVDHSG